MSKVVRTKTYLIATALGNVAVKTLLIQGYDVEDVVRQKATSQARLIQMVNVGKEIQSNADIPAESLPTVFANSDEVLPNG